MDEEPGLLDSLRRHWRALAIFTILVAGAAIYSERALFTRDVENAGDKPATPAKPAAPPAGGDAKPAEQKPADSGETKPVDEAAQAVMSQAVVVDARPALVIKGQGSKWEDAAATLADAIAKLNAVVGKGGLVANGRPIAVFTKTDDAGFEFEAMAPLAAAPEGKLKLPEGVAVGASPAGKALKFQHRGAYDEIEATYEAIAAYLDEKGVDTKDLIVEEYLTDFKGDDASVDVDIYVFLK
ncbi:GyrI-like domain-containing protein [Methylocystis sp. 9N]|uniref:GyrI-like domain-containing protein n=1 Tax=Methylocystis borbori TaxID=3118750 RepID=A0ABU7XJ25_9HYPH